MTINLHEIYSRQFLLFVEKVIALETGGKGDGWVNDKSDLGGMTMWGISSAANPKFAKLIASRKLTYEDAVKIYYDKYYSTIQYIDTIDPRLAFILFDAKVHGATATVRFIQKWLNSVFKMSLAVDGKAGPVTLSICAKLTEKEVSCLVVAYKSASSDMAAEMARNVMAAQTKNNLTVRNYGKGFTNRLLARAEFAERYMHV